MATLFISHASKDDGIVGDLQNWLIAEGFDDLFIDHTSIRGGDKWADALRAAKASCRAVICLVTEHWLASDDCFGEFLAAWYQGKRIIPLYVCSDASLNEIQQRHLTRVRSEDQGIDLSSALANGKFDLNALPEVAELLRAGLRASGALAKVGLDPEAFEIDRDARPSPFPGLESFDDSDADAAIFYGRSPEILRTLEDLREMRANGSHQPYAIIGASGSGKSSLLRAGILPRLRRERGWIALRAFRPGADPLLNFSGAIAQTFSDYGVINSPGFVRDELQAAWKESRNILKKDPELARTQLRDLLEQKFNLLRARADRPFSTVLVPLDQAEELVHARGESGDVLADYLRAALSPSAAVPEDQQSTNRIFVALTIRTDSLAALQASPRFAGLAARCADVRSVPIYRFGAAIEGPAARYGVAIETGLVELLIDDVPGEDALPLLAFSLQRLWKQYSADKMLRCHGYENLGKLSGLIEDAAERALRGMRPEEDTPLTPNVSNEVDRLAARIFVPPLAQVTDSGATVRRVARLDSFDSRGVELLERFVSWRLLIKKAGADRKEATIEVAHEAIFRSWPRLRGWVNQEKTKLQTLRDVADATRSWKTQKRLATYLDHRGRRLQQARGLLTIEDFAQQLSDDEKAYLRACRKAQLKRRVAAACLIIAAGVTLFAGIATFDTHSMFAAMRDKANLLIRGGYPSAAVKFAVAGAIGDLDIARLTSSDDGGTNLRETGFTLKMLLDLPQPYSVSKYLFSNDGQRLVVKSSNDTGAIWDVDTRTKIAEFTKPTSVAAFYLTQDQKRLIIRSADNALTLWDLRSGKKIAGSESKIFKSAKFVAEASRMTTLSEDNTCTLWDLTSGKVIATLGGEHEIDWCGLSDDGSRVLTRTIRLVANLWDAANGAIVSDFEKKGSCYTCMVSAAASRVFLIDTDGKGALHDSKSGKMLMPVQDMDRLSGATFSQDGRRFVTRSIRNNLILWNAETGERIADVGSSDADNYRFSSAGAQIFARSTNGSGELRDASNGVLLRSFPAGAIKEYKFAKSGDRLATITIEGAGMLWNSATGEKLAELGGDGEVESIIFSNDGTRMSVGSDVNPGALWDARLARKITDYREKGAEAGGIFSADGTRYVSLSSDNYATLWDAANGLFLTGLGGEGAASDSDIADDNRRVITNSIASTASVWDSGIIAGPGISGSSLRNQVCAMNYSAIGVFGRDQRDGTSDVSARLAGYLRGRPWHPCDWVGLMSMEGWAQALRYWMVKVGIPWDYRCGERFAFGAVHDEVALAVCSKLDVSPPNSEKSDNRKSRNAK